MSFKNRGINPYKEPTGNRIATVLFYVSNYDIYLERGNECVQKTWNGKSSSNCFILCMHF